MKWITRERVKVDRVAWAIPGPSMDTTSWSSITLDRFHDTAQEVPWLRSTRNVSLMP